MKMTGAGESMYNMPPRKMELHICFGSRLPRGLHPKGFIDMELNFVSKCLQALTQANKYLFLCASSTVVQEVSASCTHLYCFLHLCCTVSCSYPLVYPVLIMHLSCMYFLSTVLLLCPLFTVFLVTIIRAYPVLYPLLILYSILYYTLYFSVTVFCAYPILYPLHILYLSFALLFAYPVMYHVRICYCILLIPYPIMCLPCPVSCAYLLPYEPLVGSS